jgi:hypothetical protein
VSIVISTRLTRGRFHFHVDAYLGFSERDASNLAINEIGKTDADADRAPCPDEHFEAGTNAAMLWMQVIRAYLAIIFESGCVKMG